MIKRVLKSWTHWQGDGHHFGIHLRGKWAFKFSKHEHNTCIFYTFWRFFVSVDIGHVYIVKSNTREEFLKKIDEQCPYFLKEG